MQGPMPGPAVGPAVCPLLGCPPNLSARPGSAAGTILVGPMTSGRLNATPRPNSQPSQPLSRRRRGFGRRRVRSGVVYFCSVNSVLTRQTGMPIRSTQNRFLTLDRRGRSQCAQNNVDADCAEAPLGSPRRAPCRTKMADRGPCCATSGGASRSSRSPPLPPTVPPHHQRLHNRLHST